MNTEDPRGFRLTLSLATGALAASAFAGLTQDVVGHDEAALLDPRVLRWVLAHRSDWLTSAMKVVTWLGSTAVIVPLLVIVAIGLIVKRRDWRSSALLALAVGGAIGLYNIVKPAVGRARPPTSVWIGHYTGGSFPSGHATQSIAFYATLAIVLSAGRSGRFRTILRAAAAIIVLLVGASRIYLGAHWLSDVLGGWSLGVAWVSVLLAIHLLTGARGGGRGARAADEPEERASRRRSTRRPVRSTGASLSARSLRSEAPPEAA